MITKLFLCAVCLIKMNTPLVSGSGSTFYAKTGTCENMKTGERRCALQASDCEPTHIDGEKNVSGEKWYSSYRMGQRGIDPCTCESTRVGACFIGDADLDSSGADLNFRCAPHSESCMMSKGETYGLVNSIPLQNNAQCGCDGLGVIQDWPAKTTSVQAPKTVEKTTLYGACYKDSMNNFCAFSPSDCESVEEGYSWLDPSSALNVLGYECTCADTHIGGCVGGFGGFNCAITVDSCDWDTYYPPLRLKQTHGYSCRLCKPVENQIVKGDTIDALPFADNTGSRSTIIVGTIGGAVGVLIGVLLALLSVFVYTNLKSKADNRANTVPKELSAVTFIDGDGRRGDK